SSFGFLVEGTDEGTFGVTAHTNNLDQVLGRLIGSPQHPLDIFSDTWSVAVVSGTVLITFVANDTAIIDVDNSEFHIPLPLRMVRTEWPCREANWQAISISNFITGNRFPPAVTFLENRNHLYCVSGREVSTGKPVIVIMDETDTEVRRIIVPAEVRAIVAAPNGVDLYATLDNDTVVRVATNGVDDPLLDHTNVGVKPWPLAISSDATRLYVGDVIDPDKTPAGQIWQVGLADGQFIKP
ncbi:MAG: hypothetical protein AAGA01_09200, partial [Cyanobacteria bacterium P01_E01_bin.43]